MTSAKEGQPPSNDPEEWQDTHTAQCTCNSVTVQQCKSATVEQYKSTTVTVQRYNSAIMQQYNRNSANSATVQQWNSATVQQCKSATVQQYNSTTVQQCKSATVQHCNSIHSLPSQNDFEAMKEDLDMKEREVEKSEYTTSALQQQHEMLLNDLDKVELLEQKVKVLWRSGIGRRKIKADRLIHHPIDGPTEWLSNWQTRLMNLSRGHILRWTKALLFPGASVRWSVGRSVTQTFDDPLIGLLGLALIITVD